MPGYPEPEPAAGGVHRLVEQWVRRAPAVIAVRDPTSGDRCSYGELWERSGAVARELRRRGAGPDTVVAVALGRGIDLVVALLGIVRSGACYLPLDPHGPVGRWTEIVAAAGSTHVVVPDPRAAGPVGPARIAMSTVAGPGQFAGPPVEPERRFCVNFTSGTTGAPKGVVVPHRAVHRLVTGMTYCRLGAGDRVASLANPAFDATTFEIWAPLSAGATVVVLADPTGTALDPWLDRLRAERVTTMFLTTSLFHMIARERPDGLRSLSTLLVGGEQLEASLAGRVLAAGPPGRLVNVYGPTEATTFATYYDCTPERLAGRVPVGEPIQATEVAVVDRQLRPVPTGVEGELVIGGPGVALGYLGDPELTAERFVTLPARPRTGTWYRTGDHARRLPSGVVELLGRGDRQVKLRGFRVELPEIEQALLTTGLVDVAVVEKVGEGPAAFLAGFVLPAPGARPADLPGALRVALSRRQPDYQVPTRWCVLDTLPLGPTGKVDRDALLRSLSGGAAALPGTGPAAPGAGLDPLAERVARIWCEVLAVDRLDRGQDFITAGGNSILAIQASSRIREALAVGCEPADVLLAADVADLAGRLRAAPVTPAVPEVEC
jgi:amino acid adenylation domain-containing protein